MTDRIRAPDLAGADVLGVKSCDFRVGGMDCASCAASVEGALKRLEGVQDVRVDVMGGRVRVTYPEGKVARGDLSGAIRRVGYQVEDERTGTPRRASFTVEGTDCADEVRLIEGKLGKLPGVTRLDIDVVRHRLVVEGTITTPEVQRAVKELGMSARAEHEAAAPRSFWERAAPADRRVDLGCALRDVASTWRTTRRPARRCRRARRTAR